MFEFHELEVPGNQVKTTDVGLADNVRDRDRFIVTNRIIQRATLHQVQLRLDAMQRGKGCLGVQIDPLRAKRCAR